MLFPSSLSTVFKNHLRKYSTSKLPYKGANRRATSFLPQPMISSDILLKGAAINVRSNVLLSLEADQRSGCLIIRSEKNKSRSGILMYRGRILGCMRGQKRTGDYAFGNQAYEQTLADLANTSQTDIYGLKDEVVAAAGALFHGQMQEQPTMQDPVTQVKASVREALSRLIEANLPGCIVITDKPDTNSCIVYVFAGQIVGVHSRKQGWLKPKVATVDKHIESYRNPRVQLCIMPCQSSEEFKQYSFSLSGLADRDFKNTQRSARYEEPNIFALQRLDEERLKDAQPQTLGVNKFAPRVGQNNPSATQNRVDELDSASPYSVRP